MISRRETRAKTAAAIKSGELVRGACEICNGTPVDAHHEDYSDPLAIRWLCRRHHARRHAQLRRDGIAIVGSDWPDPIVLLTAKVPIHEHAALAELARENERSLSAETRLAIRNWLAMHRTSPVATEDAA